MTSSRAALALNFTVAFLLAATVALSAMLTGYHFHPANDAFSASGYPDRLAAAHDCWTNDGQSHPIPGHAVVQVGASLPRYVGASLTGEALDNLDARGLAPTTVKGLYFCR